MAWFETIIGAVVVIAVLYLFFRHKKELKELELNKAPSNRCKTLEAHNFVNNKCSWCNKSLKDVSK